jgi:hypothetical protein
MRKLLKAEYLPYIILIVIGLVYLSLYLSLAVKWLPYPNQIDFGEGMTMDVSKLWANGQWKWDITVPPYLTLMHGFVMPIMLTPLIKVFGWSLNLGRYLMFGATIISCGFLFLIGKEISRKWYVGLVAGLLPFTQPTIRDWSLMARPDMLAVMFSVIGIWIVIKTEKTESKWIYFSIVLFVIGILTKLSAMSGICATLLYLMINNRKVFWKYAGIFGLTIGLLFIADRIFLNGEYVTHIIKYNNTNPVFQYQMAFVNNLETVMFPLSIIMIMALTYMVRRLLKERNFALIPCYFFGTLAIDFLTALRAGSYINYFIEFILMACLTAALMIPEIIIRIKKEEDIIRNGKRILFSTSTLLITLLLFQPLMKVNYVHAFPFPNEQYDSDTRKVIEMIKDTDKPIPTENAGLVLNAGKDPLIEPFVFTNMSRLGLWDDSDYLDGYIEQEYDYLILRIPMYMREDGDGHFEKEIAHAIEDNYTLVFEPKVNCYWYGLCLYEANRKLELVKK